MYRNLLFFACLPVGLAAQGASAHPAVSPRPAGVVRARATSIELTRSPLGGASAAPVAPRAGLDTGRAPKLARYTVTGLTIGGLSGMVGGAIGSRYAGCSCSEATLTLGYALWFGAVGAAGGALIGAAVGALHDHWP